MKGDANSLQVAHTEAAKLRRHAYLPPSHGTVASSRVLPPMPEKIADHPVGPTKDGGIKSNGRENVERHGREDVSHKGKPLPTRKKGGPLGGEPLA